jgi:hypothetical protein
LDRGIKLAELVHYHLPSMFIQERFYPALSHLF